MVMILCSNLPLGKKNEESYCEKIIIGYWVVTGKSKTEEKQRNIVSHSDRACLLLTEIDW